LTKSISSLDQNLYHPIVVAAELLSYGI